jgi:hypothetical protein
MVNVNLDVAIADIAFTQLALVCQSKSFHAGECFVRFFKASEILIRS